jgi:hypothetical protein
MIRPGQGTYVRHLPYTCLAGPGGVLNAGWTLPLHPLGPMGPLASCIGVPDGPPQPAIGGPFQPFGPGPSTAESGPPAESTLHDAAECKGKH